MKHIFIARHAKADFNEEIDDSERLLTLKGIIDCQDLSRAMKFFIAPQLILCSKAKRSHETGLQIIKNLNDDIKLQLIDNLYLASENDIVSIIKSIDNIYQNVMIIGHNPSISKVAIDCANNSDISQVDLMKLSFGMSPGSVIMFEFDQLIEWKNFSDIKLSNKWLFRPS